MVPAMVNSCRSRSLSLALINSSTARVSWQYPTGSARGLASFKPPSTKSGAVSGRDTDITTTAFRRRDDKKKNDPPTSTTSVRPKHEQRNEHLQYERKLLVTKKALPSRSSTHINTNRFKNSRKKEWKSSFSGRRNSDRNMRPTILEPSNYFYDVQRNRANYDLGGGSSSSSFSPPKFNLPVLHSAALLDPLRFCKQSARGAPTKNNNPSSFQSNNNNPSPPFPELMPRDDCCVERKTF